MDDLLVGVWVRLPRRERAGHLAAVVYAFDYHALTDGTAVPPTGSLTELPPPEQGVPWPLGQATFRLAPAEEHGGSAWRTVVGQWRDFLINEVARVAETRAQERAVGAPQLRIVVLTPDTPHTDLAAARLLHECGDPAEVTLCRLFQQAAPSTRVAHAQLLLHEIAAQQDACARCDEELPLDQGARWMDMAVALAESVHGRLVHASWLARWQLYVAQPLEPVDTVDGTCRVLCVLWLLMRGSMPAMRENIAFPKTTVDS